jgi:alpha-glucosidase (family GH31 glycosyl hydrolase)
VCLQAGAKSVNIVLPEGAVWYEALGGAAFPGKAGKPLATAVHLDAIPVFYRGSHIVPRRYVQGSSPNRVVIYHAVVHLDAIPVF